MQNTSLTSSGAISTSGNNTRVYKVVVAGDHATNIGSLTLKTGGSGGTQVGPRIFVRAGETVEINLPGLVADYATLADVEVLIGFAKGARG